MAAVGTGGLRPPAGQPVIDAAGRLNVAWGEFFQDVADLLSDLTPLRLGDYLKSSQPTAPFKTLRADGSAINRIDYAPLFAVLGTGFGPGDGSTSFNLPNVPSTATEHTYIRAIP